MIRAPRPSDQAFVASSWVRSMSRTRAESPKIGRDVDLILERHDTRCLIDSERRDDNRIRGWICYADVPSMPTLHYCYVRQEFRREGIATQLLDEAGIKKDAVSIYTHHSRDANRMVTAFPQSVHVALPEWLRSVK